MPFPFGNTIHEISGLRDVIHSLAVVGVSLDFSIPYPLKPVRTAHLTFSLVAHGQGMVFADILSCFLHFACVVCYIFKFKDG